jgi:hypothetical protein
MGGSTADPPLDPPIGGQPGRAAAFLIRLQTLGFAAITIAVDRELRFTARKAAPDEQD